MRLANQLVGIGLFVVLAAVVFEYLSMHLSGMAVGFGLVVTGLVLLATGRTVDGNGPYRTACDECGAPVDLEATACEYCGAAR